jgi:hypothetical protein
VVVQVIGKDAAVLKEDAMNPTAKDEEIDEDVCQVLRDMPRSWNDDLGQPPLPGIWLDREPPVDSRKSHDADGAGESDAEPGGPASTFGSESDPIPDEDHACNI